jgi:hypothetical protein
MADYKNITTTDLFGKRALFGKLPKWAQRYIGDQIQEIATLSNTVAELTDYEEVELCFSCEKCYNTIDSKYCMHCGGLIYEET